MVLYSIISSEEKFNLAEELSATELRIFYIMRSEELMIKHKIIRLKEKPELKAEAANWFHDKWGVPIQAYLNSMDASLSGDKIQK